MGDFPLHVLGRVCAPAVHYRVRENGMVGAHLGQVQDRVKSRPAPFPPIGTRTVLEYLPSLVQEVAHEARRQQQ